jgi:hypothetical protein
MSKLNTSRRDFLKASTAGAVALSIGGPLVKKSSAVPVWVDGMQINPAIDNLRVVMCNDPGMLKSIGTGTFKSFNDNVNIPAVNSNMDQMAMTLANKTDAPTAWATIFRKPATKTWAQVNVAIKVNCIDKNFQPRIGVISKICNVLNTIGTVTDPGVPFANMTIYDVSEHKLCVTNYGSAYSKALLPAGVVVSNTLGAPTPVALPGGSEILSAGKLLDGSIDILVNITVNKGHDQLDKGKCTMCLKNHYGTYVPRTAVYPKPNGCGNLDYLLDINKSEAILGGAIPRQQLCIVDSLWAMKTGPTGGEIVRNDRLVMGTFAGAVDYLVARKIREGVMLMADQNSAAIDRYLTGFGYNLADPAVQALNLIDVQVAAVLPHSAGHSVAHISVAVPHSLVTFAIPSASGVVTVDIVDSRGRLVRSLSQTSDKSFSWDGANTRGHRVAAGSYVVRCTVGKAVQARSIIIG